MNSFRWLHHQASGRHTDRACPTLLSTLWVFNQRKIQWRVYTNASMEQEVRDGRQQVSGPSSRPQMTGSFQIHFQSSFGDRSTTVPQFLHPPRALIQSLQQSHRVPYTARRRKQKRLRRSRWTWIENMYRRAFKRGTQKRTSKLSIQRRNVRPLIDYRF